MKKATDFVMSQHHLEILPQNAYQLVNLNHLNHVNESKFSLERHAIITTPNNAWAEVMPRKAQQYESYDCAHMQRMRAASIHPYQFPEAVNMNFILYQLLTLLSVNCTNLD